MGLLPLLVLGAMLVGVQVSGLWGALFGVPVAAVIYAMARVLHHRAQEVWEQPPPGEQDTRPEPPEQT